MAKLFLTIDEQIDRLNKRGIQTDENTALYLMRDGYYAIINGYKEVFLDPQKSAAANDDRYKEGTKFTDIYTLFCFDRNLRELTFPYLIRAEATLKTAVSYCFSQEHKNCRDYISPNNYCTAKEFNNSATGHMNYEAELASLISHLKKQAKNYSVPFIRHYCEQPK